MHTELVDRRKWISNGRFLHALNYCMLLPGPEAQQLAIYIGWLLHSTSGGILAGLFFIIPSFLPDAWPFLADGGARRCSRGVAAGVRGPRRCGRRHRGVCRHPGWQESAQERRDGWRGCHVLPGTHLDRRAVPRGRFLGQDSSGSSVGARWPGSFAVDRCRGRRATRATPAGTGTVLHDTAENARARARQYPAGGPRAGDRSPSFGGCLCSPWASLDLGTSVFADQAFFFSKSGDGDVRRPRMPCLRTSMSRLSRRMGGSPQRRWSRASGLPNRLPDRSSW